MGEICTLATKPGPDFLLVSIDGVIALVDMDTGKSVHTTRVHRDIESVSQDLFEIELGARDRFIPRRRIRIPVEYCCNTRENTKYLFSVLDIHAHIIGMIDLETGRVVGDHKVRVENINIVTHLEFLKLSHNMEFYVLNQ